MRPRLLDLFCGSFGAYPLLPSNGNEGRMTLRERWRRRRSIVVNPVGWDEQHQRTHDVGFQIDGALMHYSTCWCRRPCECHA